MTLRNRAARVAWPRRWCLAVAGLMALGHLSGCSHNRQTSYRPIFARPTSGCSTCGGSSGTVSSGTVTTEGATSMPTTTVPTLTAPTTDSNVTPSTSIRGGSGNVRSSTVERPPTAQPVEPEWDAFAPTQRNSAKPPSSPPEPASPGAAPKLQAPNSGQSGTTSTWNPDDPDARPTGRAASSTQPASSTRLAARLEPYIAGSSANELFNPNKADRPWRYVVLHHSASAAGNYDEIDREHRKLLGYDGCGYHFIIGNGHGSEDGQIEVAQRWNNQKQGVHCRNARSHEVDEYGIGICLVGDLDKQAPTPRQIAATQALVAYLSQRYRIDTDHVSTHAHLAATPTVCPGKFFPATLLAGTKGEGPGAS
jgi:N-acetylmuramoyl-L-alanine amidase